MLRSKGVHNRRSQLGRQATTLTRLLLNNTVVGNSTVTTVA